MDFINTARGLPLEILKSLIRQDLVGAPRMRQVKILVDKKGDKLYITVEDPAAVTDPSSINTVTVSVTSSSNPEGLKVTLVETGPGTGVFKGVVMVTSEPKAGAIYARPGDKVTVKYEITETVPIE